MQEASPSGVSMMARGFCERLGSALHPRHGWAILKKRPLILGAAPDTARLVAAPKRWAILSDLPTWHLFGAAPVCPFRDHQEQGMISTRSSRRSSRKRRRMRMWGSKRSRSRRSKRSSLAHAQCLPSFLSSRHQRDGHTLSNPPGCHLFGCRPPACTLTFRHARGVFAALLIFLHVEIIIGFQCRCLPSFLSSRHQRDGQPCLICLASYLFGSAAPVQVPASIRSRHQRDGQPCPTCLASHLFGSAALCCSATSGWTNSRWLELRSSPCCRPSLSSR